ncbi:hypothetical protein [Synechococcus sp. MIT S1220]|uniref:hypothetical protein n=1 Tax=Synechococcus sp. MIT S1220 TaxID=3082549 RepID=UPI0039AE9FD3
MNVVSWPWSTIRSKTPGSAKTSRRNSSKLAKWNIPPSEWSALSNDLLSCGTASPAVRCLVCNEEMTVARVTKTTLSDRCRKQWIREGAEAFPLPETPTHVQIGKSQITVKEAASR